jgi:hypothetical protein
MAESALSEGSAGNRLACYYVNRHDYAYGGAGGCCCVSKNAGAIMDVDEPDLWECKPDKSAGRFPKFAL